MAERTLEEILVNLRQRVAALERRGITRGRGRRGAWQEWGGKSGVTQHTTAYKSTWTRGIDSGGSIDAHSNPQGILITVDGTYEVRSVMRGGPSGTAAYHSLALNGNRAAFEGRSTDQATMVGVWTHSHPAANNNFTESHYIGALYAGDLITAGVPDISHDIQTGTGATAGSLIVKRIT
jgi:hypothetical protein